MLKGEQFLHKYCPFFQAQEGVRADLDSLGTVLHDHFMEHGQRFRAVKNGQERFLL